MKPFNLEKAKAGKPVITRDGREVTQLTIFDSTDNYCIAGVLDKSVQLWDINGKFSLISEEGENNLFMKTEIKTLWFNLYHNRIGKGFEFGEIFDTEEKVLSYSGSTYYISTHSITIEV